jgi:acyl-CoA synthetase (AMP-forming)/AMP-acid ligase II
MSTEEYGRCAITKSRNPYTCGLTGKTRDAFEVIAREDYLARGIGQALKFDPQRGSEWDKVVGVYSFNTVRPIISKSMYCFTDVVLQIDYIPLTHSIHRLNGVVSLSSAALSSSELEDQLRLSKAKAIFTCQPLLEAALKATAAVGIPNDHIFLLPMPDVETNPTFRTIEDLIEVGKKLPDLPSLNWSQGQAARQAAYLCYSSGTSGLPVSQPPGRC